MKILHLANIDELNPNVGLRKALASFAETDGYREIDWRKFRKKDLKSKFSELAADLTPADLVFAQIQGENPIDDARMKACKAFKVHACWDIRNNTPNWAFDMGKQFDLMLFNNQRDIDNLNAVGSKAAFLQVGFCPEVFHPDGPKRPNTPPIVFLGSNYNSFPGSKFRAEMVMALQNRYGKDFGVFGRNWGTDVPFLKQEEEAACYRACKIAVSQSHAGVAGYTSDRLYRAMGSGALTLAQETSGVTDEWNSKKPWASIDELIVHIDCWMNDVEKTEVLAKADCMECHERFAWLPRFTQFFEMLPNLGGPKAINDVSVHTEEDQLAPGVNIIDEIVKLQARENTNEPVMAKVGQGILPAANWHLDLAKYAKKIHSQNGEDGIIARIFDCIGTTNKFFVDIGAGDGVTLSNTACLREAGWSGLAIDKTIEGKLYHRDGTIYMTLAASATNIVNAFDFNEDIPVPKDFDFLSLDIDGQDYHVLKAILDGGLRPRVICVEFNGTKPAWPAITVPQQDDFAWDSTDYYGASLGAFTRLLSGRYTLCHIEKSTNLFFVPFSSIPINLESNDWIARLFNSHNPIQYHRADRSNRPWISLK